jgi:Protein phosphatase 2C
VFREFHHQARGRGHLLDGTRGQDRTGYLSRGGVQAMCLADGAGSASHSEHGAEALVNEGCRLLAERFTDFVTSDDGLQVKLDILQCLRDRLKAIAGRRECELENLAATFLAVAVSGNRFVIVHVGDGVIGYVKNGELRVASAPDNDEFANQTTFVTSRDAASRMRLSRGSLDGVSGFVLMSDGTASSLYNWRTKELAPACAKLVTLVGSASTRQVNNPAHHKYLRKLIDTRIRRATKDDCSIGILGRRLAPASMMAAGEVAWPRRGDQPEPARGRR